MPKRQKFQGSRWQFRSLALSVIIGIASATMKFSGSASNLHCDLTEVPYRL